MKRFEFFEVTADAGYWAYGHTLEEVFENAALAMFEIMTDTSLMAREEIRKIEVRSEDEVSLLYDWLDELLFLHDTEFILFSKFNVKIDETADGFKLRGTAAGESESSLRRGVNSLRNQSDMELDSSRRPVSALMRS